MIRNVCISNTLDSAYCEFTDFTFTDRIIKMHNNSKSIRYNSMTMSYAIDIARTKQYQWAAIVIRNLPMCIKQSNILLRCGDDGERVKYVLPPMQVKRQNCTIVVMEDLEDAEKVCYRLNKNVVKKTFVLKVNLLNR